VTFLHQEKKKEKKEKKKEGKEKKGGGEEKDERAMRGPRLSSDVFHPFRKKKKKGKKKRRPEPNIERVSGPINPKKKRGGGEKEGATNNRNSPIRIMPL